MKLEEPRFLPMGEMGLCVEYGDETDLELSFRVSALAKAVDEADITGVLDYVVCVRSLGIVFDPDRISRANLTKEVAAIDAELEITHGVLSSRLLVLPIWYDDPWSAEAAVRWKVPRNIDLVAEHNGLTIEELIQVHSGTEHWVGAVGANPGTYLAYPLDHGYTITAPKYENPRTSTPVRTLCVAGRETGSYPVDVAGGFQLIGRGPFDWWDPTQSNEAFKDSPALTRVGDRHKYVPIGEEDYHELRAAVKAGEYEYDIREETFDVAAWIAERDATDVGST
jgi:urea carboxylase